MVDEDWRPPAREGFYELSNDVKEEVLDEIDAMKDAGIFSYENVKMIKDRNGEWRWRLKIKNDADHRLIFDYTDGTLVFLLLGHRDDVYAEE